MTPSNRSTIVCVVDTETTFINETPRMVYHFGATFGDIEQEQSFNVVKMTLAKRAAENIGLDSLTEYFSGPTGVTVIESDPVEAAKEGCAAISKSSALVPLNVILRLPA